MALSVLSTNYLAFFVWAFSLVIVGGVTIQSFKRLEDEGGLAREEYFKVAVFGFLSSVAAALATIGCHLFLPDEAVPHRGTGSDYLELLWVFVVVSLVAAFFAPALVALANKVWDSACVLLRKPLGWWCDLLSHGNSSD